MSSSRGLKRTWLFRLGNCGNESSISGQYGNPESVCQSGVEGVGKPQIVAIAPRVGEQRGQVMALDGHSLQKS